jgi:hypothetical protein
MADAFDETFIWATALLCVAFLASLTLPKRRPPRPEGAEAPLPMIG